MDNWEKFQKLLKEQFITSGDETMKRVGESTSEAFAEVRKKLAAAAGNEASIEYCVKGLEYLERCLAKRPRVVVVGQPNSGKTSMINELLGAEVLPTGVLANTPVPVTLSYGEHAIFANTTEGWIRVQSAESLASLRGTELKEIEICVPNLLLQNFDLVDTPSGGDILQSVAGSDIVVWCTLAPRAWMETERQTWSLVPYRCRQNALLAATHADGIFDSDELVKVKLRLQNCTSGLFNGAYFVSSMSSGDMPEFSGLSEDLQQEIKSSKEALLEEIDVLAAGVVERRVKAAKRIAQRLARVAHQSIDLSGGASDAFDDTISGRWLSQWERLLASAAQVDHKRFGTRADAYQRGRRGDVGASVAA